MLPLLKNRSLGARVAVTSAVTSAALSVLTSAALSAAAPALPSWAPPGAEHALILSVPREALREYSAPLSIFSQRVEDISAEAGEPALKALSDHLKSIDWERGAWGGVDLTRGVALYVTADERIRFVVGVSDEQELRAQLTRHADALGGAPSLKGLTLSGHELRCGLLEGWWVCDSAPFEEGPAPAWAAEVPSNASLWARFGGGEHLNGAARALHINAPTQQIEAITLSVISDHDAQQRLTLTTLDVALSNPALMMLAAPAAPSRTLSAAHALSPLTALLALPMTALRPFAAQGLTAAPPALQPTLKLALEALNGEVQLSFAGSLFHPVLSLGLTAPRGDELLKGLVAAASSMGAPVSAAEEGGVTSLRLSPSPKANITLKALSAPRALHIALHSADLQRLARAEGQDKSAAPALPFEAIAMPSSAAGALLAMHVTATPRGLLDALTALNEVLEINLPGGGALHLGPVMALFAQTYDRMIDATLWLGAAPGHVTLNALSRSLGGDL